MLLLALGCTFGPPPGTSTQDSKDLDSAARDSADTGEEEQEGPKDPTFAVEWDADEVRVKIVGAHPNGKFHIGLAQTDQCGQGCWTGEDCLHGQDGWSYCHPSDHEGVALTYGADPNTLVEGQQTVFTHANFAYVTTYVVIRDFDGQCWAFGHDPAYYAPLGCIAF